MLLYGAGGHAKVILDCLSSQQIICNGIFDDNLNLKELKNIPILGKYDSNYLIDNQLIISIGDNIIRKKVSENISHSFGIVKHSSAQISSSVEIQKGTVIFHLVIVQGDAQIGKHVILNTACVVEHDCQVADYVHIAPKTVVCGNVKIGEGTLIGTNATILPNLTIGKWCKIGAGAVVTRSIPDYTTVVGIPAKVIKN